MAAGPAAVIKAAWLERFIPRSDIQVSKKQNVFSPLTGKDSVLWGASVTER